MGEQEGSLEAAVDPRQAQKAARVLLTLPEKDPRRIFEGEALIRRMVRLGLLKESERKLDYVLGLTIAQFMERRLQTLVMKRKIGHSVHHPVCSSTKSTLPLVSRWSTSPPSWSASLPSSTSNLPPPPASSPVPSAA